MFTEVQLNNSYVSLINDCDLDLINRHNWFVINDGHNPYACSKKNGMHIRMHRLIVNAREGQIVDHINGNTLDNRRENLRIVSASQNAINRRKRSDNKSGVTGVHFSKAHNRWFACINIDKKKQNIGLFKTMEEAVAARKEKEKEVYGDYVRPENLKGIQAEIKSYEPTPNILRRVSKKNITGKRGIRFAPQRNKTNPYSARIACNGQNIHLGYFPTFEDACAAREKAERTYFPQYFKTS
jgi:hypothetical protein